MDPQAFDRLARALAPAASRRRALGLVLAAALAPVAAAAKPAPGKKARCLAISKLCTQSAGAGATHAADRRKRKHHPPSCSKCCSGFGATGTDGKARCACK